MSLAYLRIEENVIIPFFLPCDDGLEVRYLTIFEAIGHLVTVNVSVDDYICIYTYIFVVNLSS